MVQEHARVSPHWSTVRRCKRWMMTGRRIEECGEDSGLQVGIPSYATLDLHLWLPLIQGKFQPWEYISPICLHAANSITRMVLQREKSESVEANLTISYHVVPHITSNLLQAGSTEPISPTELCQGMGCAHHTGSLASTTLEARFAVS